MAVLSGGTVMKSAGYKLILSTGESPGGNATMSSSNFKLRSGVVGATQ
jgi:hypothetical protein